MAELVYSFLIPEIEKMSIRQRGIIIAIMIVGIVVKIILFIFFLVHQRQQRHLQAARIIIQETLEHDENDPRSLRSSQSSCPSEGASSLDSKTSHVDEEPE